MLGGIGYGYWEKGGDYRQPFTGAPEPFAIKIEPSDSNGLFSLLYWVN